MTEPGVHAKFFKKAVLNVGKSKTEGRQFYEDRDYIEIKVAGMDKEVHVAPVNDSHKARFAEEWKRYVEGAELKRQGTPVRQWPQLTPSQVAMLEDHNIFTVEDMAALPDFGLAALGMGARKMQEDARKFLSLAQGAVDLAQLDELRAENVKKQEQIDALHKSLATLTEQVAELMAAKPEGKRKKQPQEAAAE